MTLERRCLKLGYWSFWRSSNYSSPAETLLAWEIRRDRFSHFVGLLSGVGWNTFDYVLRDLGHPGCLLLFKVDSTNDAMMERIGSPINRDRSKYLDVLADLEILDRYPVAVVNMAIYAFCSGSCLGFLSRIVPSNGGYGLRLR